MKPRRPPKRRDGPTPAQRRRRTERRVSKRALALAAALQAPWPAGETAAPGRKRRR